MWEMSLSRVFLCAALGIALFVGGVELAVNHPSMPLAVFGGWVMKVAGFAMFIPLAMLRAASPDARHRHVEPAEERDNRKLDPFYAHEVTNIHHGTALDPTSGSSRHH
jgi:hypothetical protein